MSLLVGWIFCPHCEFRRRVCVALAGPAETHDPLVVRCPLDRSCHLIGWEGFVPVAECPPDLAVARPTDFAPPDHPYRRVAPPRRPWWKFW